MSNLTFCLHTNRFKRNKCSLKIISFSYIRYVIKCDEKMQLTVSPKHFNQRFISDLLPKTPERKILSHFHS